MNKLSQLVLELEEQLLTRQALVLNGPFIEEASLFVLNKKIDKLRRQLPSQVLARFDRLASQYVNPMTTVSQNVCQGCFQRVSPALARQLPHSSQLHNCENCGRFLLEETQAPDFLASA